MFNTGLIIGRFQPLHKGHVQMIKLALSMCHKLFIYVGSANDSRNERNPFTYDERYQMIHSIFYSEINKGIIQVCPLEDQGLGDCPEWGKFVMDKCREDFGSYPDLFISGVEKNRPSWFNSDNAPLLSELRISRNVTGEAATTIRKMIVNNYPDNIIKGMLPEELHNLYDKYKKIILEEIK